VHFYFPYAWLEYENPKAPINIVLEENTPKREALRETTYHPVFDNAFKIPFCIARSISFTSDFRLPIFKTHFIMHK
jgi:hypothetical protein